AHFGKFAGLGSRHNVRHWGDGAKEARISMAGYRRFYYYLTTDERTGDQMREMLVADYTVAAIDSMRKALPRNAADKQFPGRLRAGPDWFALLSNWMTEWERTGETKYRDKMYTGMDSIAAMPYWLRTGPSLVMGYYPETGKLVARTQTLGSYNLVTNMGGPEVIAELNEYIDHPTWKKIWLQYCRLSGAPANVITQDMKTGNEGSNGQYAGGGRMAAYAYYVTKNPAFAQKAMGAFPAGGGGKGQQKPKILQGPEVLNTIEESRTGLITNNVVQSSLQMIEVLELCKDQLPQKAGKGGGKGK
ncbi:MAG TPA: hypothetical protein VE988_19335, partial [Gemmataceae bacterium]|nr:hypothetical protein [Gemmataceae bacterium]